MITPRRSRVDDAIWRGVPVFLTVLAGVGYVLVVLWETGEGASPTHGGWLSAVLVLAQAGLLLLRYRRPAVVLVAVTALDAAALIISSGELGTASFAVMIAVYAHTRQRRERSDYALTIGLAVVSAIVTIVGLQSSSEVPGAWVLPFALLRSALTFGAPLVIAEIVDGRARLIDALRERADSAERERERRAEQAVLRERALMARELHDIAAHHLTGIIVGAQAADALRLTDPDRAGDYIRQVQTDARTTLSNLRQTVGLLRAGAESEFAPVPSIEQLRALVADASAAGTPVRFSETGEAVGLGPLAEIAAYRMVQESLANSLQHAPGASREVEVAYGTRSVRVTVGNDAAAPHGAPHDAHAGGFGLLGMAERAELIGATLTTGRTADGGWRNVLEIPYDAEQP